MIAIKELKDWLNQFDDGDNMVAIDDGGLSLVILPFDIRDTPQAQEDIDNRPYFEVGGIPEEEQDTDLCDTCGRVLSFSQARCQVCDREGEKD